MIENKDCERSVTRLKIATPLGEVFLAGFAQKPNHRLVIFDLLSEASGRRISATDLVESKEDTRPRFPCLDFDVNWTHSNGYCVLAYGEPGSLGKMRLGVDLERHSAKRLPLARRFFAPQEADWLDSLGDCAEDAFFFLWCRKEAFYKCVGGDFFKGSLGRSMLQDCPPVHFEDLEGAKIGAPMKASLCVAVSPAETPELDF